VLSTVFSYPNITGSARPSKRSTEGMCIRYISEMSIYFAAKHPSFLQDWNPVTISHRHTTDYEGTLLVLFILKADWFILHWIWPSQRKFNSIILISSLASLINWSITDHYWGQGGILVKIKAWASITHWRLSWRPFTKTSLTEFVST